MKRSLATSFAVMMIAAVPVVSSAQTTTDKVKDKVEQKTESTGSKVKGAAEKAGTATKDSWLTSKTKIALFADERVSGRSVNVTTKNGVVTLRGKVRSEEEKKAAEEIASRAEGVTKVKNELQVVPSAQAKAVDAKDDDIKKAVQERLKKDARLKDAGIDVRADNGVVTLTGDVKDLNARARASELARDVRGVKAVKNEIKEKG